MGHDWGITFSPVKKQPFFSRFCSKKARFQAFFKIVLGFKSNKRSHSGDNGDEDPPVPIPREQSAALPKVFRLRKAAEHRS